ncbi:MAG: DUF3417 domain-containing protein [Candidatus Rokuibacteriota bacterium]
MTKPQALSAREPDLGIDALTELTLNLRWAWHHGTDKLWAELEPELWALTHNPWVVLQTAQRGSAHLRGCSIEADALWTTACGAERWRGTMDTIAQDLACVADAELWAMRTVGSASSIMPASARPSRRPPWPWTRTKPP